MYLSHIPLNPARSGARQLVASRQRLHAAVLSCLPPSHRDLGRVLWRLDSDGPHQLDLWIASPMPPSFEPLIQQAGWTASPGCRTAAYDKLLDSLASGQRWVFRLEANPTISLKGEGRTRGKRVPLVKRAAQLDWLLARQERLGFRIPVGSQGRPNLDVSNRREYRFDRRHEARTDAVSLLGVRFDGVLEVVDSKLLCDALTRGIGSGKGYGCGLMTLAKMA